MLSYKKFKIKQIVGQPISAEQSKTAVQGDSSQPKSLFMGCNNIHRNTLIYFNLMNVGFEFSLSHPSEAKLTCTSMKAEIFYNRLKLL